MNDHKLRAAAHEVTRQAREDVDIMADRGDGGLEMKTQGEIIVDLRTYISELEEALQKIAYGQFTRWECQQIARHIVMEDSK